MITRAFISNGVVNVHCALLCNRHLLAKIFTWFTEHKYSWLSARRNIQEYQTKFRYCRALSTATCKRSIWPKRFQRWCLTKLLLRLIVFCLKTWKENRFVIKVLLKVYKVASCFLTFRDGGKYEIGIGWYTATFWQGSNLPQQLWSYSWETIWMIFVQQASYFNVWFGNL